MYAKHLKIALTVHFILIILYAHTYIHIHVDLYSTKNMEIIEHFLQKCVNSYQLYA